MFAALSLNFLGVWGSPLRELSEAVAASAVAISSRFR